MDAFGNIDSKYRFIILAAKRAKQLLKGAKPKIQTRSKSLIRIAQTEVRQGLVEYEIIPTGMDEIPEREERVFVGAGLGDEGGDMDALSGKDIAEEGTGAEPEEEPEEEEGGDGEAEEEEEESKSDKDE